MAFFKEIRHYFSIFFGFLREFLVALNASFTSTIEKGLNGERATGNGQRATGNGQRERDTWNVEWGTGNGKLKTRNSLGERGNGQRATGNSSLGKSV